jgi:hypothetical protein
MGRALRFVKPEPAKAEPKPGLSSLPRYLRHTRTRPRPHSTVHIHTHKAFVSLANAVSFIFWGAHTVLVRIYTSMRRPGSSTLIPLSRPLFSRHTLRLLSAVDVYSTRIYWTLRNQEPGTRELRCTSGVRHRVHGRGAGKARRRRRSCIA